jgi:hypothetical protein
MVTTGARLMTKYTFIAEHEDVYGNPSGHKVSTEFTADHISTVIENFQMFLSGVGFQTQGTLDFIPDEEYYGTGPEWHTEEFDTPQQDFSDHGGGSVMADYPELYDAQDLPMGKSKYFFDTQRNK